jgi:hypothetical protein
MGLLGSLTGWDQDKAAGNAVLANHLLPDLDKNERRNIVKFLVNAFGPGKSDEVVIKMLNRQSRVSQLNCIAMACGSLGIAPKLNDGMGWRNVKQPQSSGESVRPTNIEVMVNHLKRKTGVLVDWPGDNVQIDFSSRRNG